MGIARSGYEMDPSRINWLEAYEDQEYLDHIAGALIVFGAERFKGANIVKGLSHLEAIHRHRVKGITTIKATAMAMQPFMMDWLIDEIRICIFFENFMKAVLLHNGAIIHTFKDKITPPQPRSERKPTKAEQLYRAQQKQPIAGSSLKANGIKDELQQHRTIEMSLMLTPKYQKVIGLPKDVLAIVKRYNYRRNLLHLTTEVSGEMNKETIKEIKLLDAFVDLQMTGIEQR